MPRTTIPRDTIDFRLTLTHTHTQYREEARLRTLFQYKYCGKSRGTDEKKKTPSLLVHTRKQQQHTHTQTLKAVERSIKFDESVLRFFTHKIDDGKIFSNPTRNKDGEWKPNPKRSFRGL